MGLASNQARLNVLTVKRNDLEYRLMNLTNQSMILAAKQADVVAKKAQALQAFNNKHGEDYAVTFTSTTAYADYETAMAQLEIADSNLTKQQQAAETEYKAVTAEEEEIKKLVESNAKNSFGYFK